MEITRVIKADAREAPRAYLGSQHVEQYTVQCVTVLQRSDTSRPLSSSDRSAQVPLLCLSTPGLALPNVRAPLAVTILGAAHITLHLHFRRIEQAERCFEQNSRK